MHPFDEAPEIEQEKGQSDKEQTQSHSMRGGSRADGIHQAITGLNAKATAVLVENLVRAQLEVTDDQIGEAHDTPALVTSFAVAADNGHTQGLLAVFCAGARIGRPMTLASAQELARAAAFAALGQ